MLKNPKPLLTVFALFVILFLQGCKKEYVTPTLNTAQIQDITYTSAKTGGEVTDNGGTPVFSRGICWSTNAKPTITDNFLNNGTGSGGYSATIEGLTPGTTYHVRAFARNSAGVGYGNEYSFETLPFALSTLTTVEVSQVTLTSAVGGGNITNDGGSIITSRGICWSTSPAPTTDGSKTQNGTGTGSFTSDLTELTPGTTYYLRAYATNIAGTAYGNEITFTTTAVTIPVLTTAEVSDITLNTATSGGSITDDGGGNITVRGVCWNTLQNPTTADNKTSDGTGKGSFVSSISPLLPGTTYYLRAYATNSAGTSYGNEVSFTTIPVVIPVLTTSEATSVTASSAVTGGNITNDGGAPVTLRGVCWSTSETPTIAGNKTENESGTGTFTSNIAGLSGGTTYYARAYATNSAGTGYGNQITIATRENTIPSLTTTELSEISSTTAKTGGNISSTGGNEITANGICWSTSENPTLSDNFTSDATGTAAFASTMTGLNDGTVYYARAYATNSIGTAYGNQLTFITPVTDIEGNLYNTVIIGGQVWMAANLKTTKLNDNTDIPDISSTSWTTYTTPAFSWYNNNVANKEVYGALYNWHAVNTGTLCPAGWHVPSDAEFNTLEVQLGTTVADVNIWGSRGTDQGTQLKSTSTWEAGGNGTNSSGFNALAGGYRQWNTGSFWGEHTYTYFWSSTDDAANGNPTVAWYRRLDSADPRVFKATTDKKGGKYIRCVKD